MGPKKTPSRRETQSQVKRDLPSPGETSETKKGKLAASPLSHEEMFSDTDAEQPVSNIVMSPEDLAVISKHLTETFQAQIETMVKHIADLVIPEIVKGVTAKLESRVRTLEGENDFLRKRVSQLEVGLDSAEQYSRRNNIRISGLPETPDESTDDLVLGMSRAMGAGLSIEEIDRSHRVGPKRGKDGNSTSRPRDIIVKFVSYRSRQKLVQKRGALKSCGYAGKFINEDLTRSRSLLLYKCRELKRQGRIQDTWSTDGKILVKDRSGKICPVMTESDLSHLS